MKLTTLADFFEHAWRALEAGAGPQRSPFAIAHLATRSAAGADVRAVALRRANRAAATVGFNTDLRAPKVAQLRRDALGTLLAYDARGGVALRVRGRCALTPHCATAWRATAARSRVCYRQRVAPGTVLAQPASVDPAAAQRAPADADAGLENFCAVTLHIAQLELLDLRASGHRRARFLAPSDSVDLARPWAGEWLAQ